MKVSIIIPVYNVEKYIMKCINSVFEQTYKNIEIILVDDGSIDKSGEICDEIVKDNNDVIVIHKENGGLSSARNSGIEMATGDAIFFLDSDDYISSSCIENCVSMLINNNADISIVQMCYISEFMNEEIINTEKEKIEVLSCQEAIEASLYQIKYSCCAPAKLYKKEVIGDLRFPLNKLSEDLATCHLLFNNANKIVYSNIYGYYYRQHENSIMHSFNVNRLDAIEWANSIEVFCREKYPQILKAARCRTFNVSIHLFLDLPEKGELHDKYFHLIWNELKRTRKDVFFNVKVRKREKIAAVLSLGGEKIVRFSWKRKFAIKQKNH